MLSFGGSYFHTIEFYQYALNFSSLSLPLQIPHLTGDRETQADTA